MATERMRGFRLVRTDTTALSRDFGRTAIAGEIGALNWEYWNIPARNGVPSV